MSYNIDTFKVKKLSELTIPIAAFFEHERSDWHPEQEYDENGKLKLNCGCGQEITGSVDNNILKVESISMSGEGSGTFVDLILEPALVKSSGVLEAACVWEGGDCINRLIVSDGVVKWEDVEI